jgi:hypothetical protein
MVLAIRTAEETALASLLLSVRGPLVPASFPKLLENTANRVSDPAARHDHGAGEVQNDTAEGLGAGPLRVFIFLWIHAWSPSKLPPTTWLHSVPVL